MAEIERIDIVKLTMTSRELELIVRALSISEGQFSTVAEDDEARKLHRELNG